ncbi:MAG: hypothetical protein KKC84_03570 [Candidatus Omnitrophica bacterium]|nr:hypothetical protein [Candidatus Omnitrophota bacterium]
MKVPRVPVAFLPALVICIVINHYTWIKLDPYPLEGHGLIAMTPALHSYWTLQQVLENE